MTQWQNNCILYGKTDLSKFTLSDISVLLRHCIPTGGPRLFTNEDIEHIQLYHGVAGSGEVTYIMQLDLT